MGDLIRLTDLKNWAYCPRVVYYHRVMPEAAPMTGKMRSGLKAQAVVDYKLTSGDPGDNHRLQLHGYAVLVERAYGVRVDQSFLYRIPDERVFVVPIEKEGRERVVSAVE